MKNTGKKRQLLAATLILALAAAVAVNWYYTKALPESTASASPEENTRMLGDTVLVAATAQNEEAEGDAAQSEADSAAFAELQMKQTQERDRLHEEIEDILKREQLDEAAQQQVTKLLEQYQAQYQAQTNCETLIRAKIGGQAIVLIDGQNAQVIVERGRLNEQTSLQITEILQTTGQIPAENLTILEVNS